MKKLISIFIFLIFTNSVSAQTLYAKIVKVKDGDTVVAIDKEKKKYTIRLGCIDAPELKQNFGVSSKNFLEKICYNQNVIIKIKNKDKYKRNIGTLYKENLNIDINLQMVSEGYAWVYNDYCNNIEYLQAEEKAKIHKKGIWSQNNQIPPWIFRKIKK